MDDKNDNKDVTNGYKEEAIATFTDTDETSGEKKEVNVTNEDLEQTLDATMKELGVKETGREGKNTEAYYKRINDSLHNESAMSSAKSALLRMGRKDAADMLDKMGSGSLSPSAIDKAFKAGSAIMSHGKGKRGKAEAKKKKH